MVRVLTEADVRDNEQVGISGLQLPRRALHDPLGRIRARADSILLVWQSEEEHRGDIQLSDCTNLLDHAVNGKLRHARH
jgi:hypothetical protein